MTISKHGKTLTVSPKKKKNCYFHRHKHKCKRRRNITTDDDIITPNPTHIQSTQAPHDALTRTIPPYDTRRIPIHHWVLLVSSNYLHAGSWLYHLDNNLYSVDSDFVTILIFIIEIFLFFLYL